MNRDTLGLEKLDVIEVLGKPDVYEVVASPDNRYLITRQGLVEGNHTNIYIGWDNEKDISVRLKMPFYGECREIKNIQHTGMIKKFLDEAWLLHLSEHENVAELIDYTVANIYGHAVPVIVMENVQGTLLHDLRSEYLANMRTSEKLGLIRAIGSGIDHIHRKGLLHGDLSDRAVVVSKDVSKSKIIDFGGSMLIDNLNLISSYSPGFTPPSVLSGKQWTVEDEVWAFTALTFVILSNGYYPYGKSNNPDVTEQRVKDPKNLIRFEKTNLVKLYGERKSKLLDDVYESILNERDGSLDNCIKVYRNILKILES